MQPRSIILELKRNGTVFKDLLEDLPFEAQKWKPDVEKWCPLEIVCHLLDEEVEDFRARTQHVLETPDLPLKPIKPQRWPKDRNYLGQDFKLVLQNFLDERQKSVNWLQSLQDPKWEQTVDHPEVGPRSAKKFLINWLAHDYHHIRQINAIRYDYLKFRSGDDLAYAGNW
ncbi:DinB family protein [Allomuricauda sp. SCSIO 65647]|uniref:DinB family protein n=1 Tax=Allomuricauda sp. SCSIO 65647 TaxID=2908843 RepID=UPI001F310956|nr:DinB family protein [Muricauda sp. SCSIO 65647]UJH68069.1 DinB family protein [Muricauda sp. SCSIO 65647]